MAKNDFMERLLEQVSEVVNEDMSDDDLREALNAEIDPVEITRNIIHQDEEIKVAYRDKVRQLLLKKIEEVESLEEIGDEFSLVDSLPPKMEISTLVPKIIAQDSEIQESLSRKLKEFIKNEIKNIDENELPEHDDLWDLAEMSNKICQSDASIEEKLQAKLKELIIEDIENNLDSESLPEGWLSNILTSDKLEPLLLRNPDLPKKIEAKLPELVDNILEEPAIRSLLREKLLASPELSSVMDAMIQEVLKSQQFLKEFQQLLGDRMKERGYLFDKIIDGFVVAAVNFFTEKLFKSKSY